MIEADNISKSYGKKEILMYSLQGHFIKQFNSVTEASRKINIPRKTNIRRN